MRIAPGIKLRHLEAFLAIARLGGLTDAADEMGVTQPAISKTLKELEELLGAVLMDRGRGGVSLTAEGEIFRHYAGLSLAALREGLDGLEQARMGSDRLLRVGALPSVAASIIPRAAELHLEYGRGATLDIVTGPNGHMLDQLRAGALHVVIGRLGLPEAMQGLSFQQLYTEQVALVVRPGHPLLGSSDLARLPEFPVLFPNRTAAIRPMVERLMVANGIGQVPRRIETVSNAFGRAFTLGCDAVWIISQGVVARDLADETLHALPVDTRITLGPVGISTRAGEAPAPDLVLFTAVVRDVVAHLRPAQPARR
ncbi:pca operon transcription factor PcaQ [Stappia sp. ES.058]|uniref:pca operon transcription factor PcaQ n=1 Tax=Stappia sp. ES.058 TaxID=1881061 RepID=UPI00087A2023|nr:pca operon transcription factor PcaQ [Stappia sp. ES.058]SDU43733.1 LysR family transcriptional regulator, pca operon transcriptional activator [Stappia sp. ES.058]